MPESRVQRWRNAKRQQGMKAVTAWMSTEEAARLKALALQWHTSPSEVLRHAFAQFSSTPQTHSSTVTDIELIRQLIRDELAAMPVRVAPVSETVTVTPPDTRVEALPPSPAVTDTVTEADTDTKATAPTVPAMPAERPRVGHTWAYGGLAQAIAAYAQHQGTPFAAADVAHALGVDPKDAHQALARLAKQGLVRREGQQRQTRYVWVGP